MSALPGAQPEITEAKATFLESCWAGGTGGGKMVSKGQRREPSSLKPSHESRLLKRDLTGPCQPGWSCIGVGTAPGGCDQNTGTVS